MAMKHVRCIGRVVVSGSIDGQAVPQMPAAVVQDECLLSIHRCGHQVGDGEQNGVHQSAQDIVRLQALPPATTPQAVVQTMQGCSELYQSGHGVWPGRYLPLQGRWQSGDPAYYHWHFHLCSGIRDG